MDAATISLILAYILGGITVLLAILTLETKKLTRATFYFGILAVLLGEIYILLGAEFVGVIQILAYAAGVAILIIFSLMFIPRTETGEEIPYSGRLRAIIGAAMVVLFVMAMGYFSGKTEGGIVATAELSKVLLGGYALVVVSVVVLLFVTMISTAYIVSEAE